MKSTTQFVAVSLMSAVISGCMCMMPMNDRSMKEKKDMGMTKVDEQGSGMSMIGTTVDKPIGNQTK